MSSSRPAGAPSSSGNRTVHTGSRPDPEANPYEAFYSRTHCNQKARVGHGTHYPVDEEELRILQSETFSPSSAGWRGYRSPISMSVADERLQQRPDPLKPEALGALDRIREYTAEGRPIVWDLAAKMFHDFDTAYFKGILRGRVLLQWVEFKAEPGIFAADPKLANVALTLPPDTPPNDRSRVRIYMRSDFRWDKLPRLYIPSCLLHEMLHAYFIVNCGGEGAQEIGAEDSSHGPLFVRAARWLEEKSGLDLLSDWHELALRRERGSRGGEA